VTAGFIIRKQPIFLSHTPSSPFHSSGELDILSDLTPQKKSLANF
jgi:hypothetical protein